MHIFLEKYKYNCLKYLKKNNKNWLANRIQEI